MVVFSPSPAFIDTASGLTPKLRAEGREHWQVGIYAGRFQGDEEQTAEEVSHCLVRNRSSQSRISLWVSSMTRLVSLLQAECGGNVAPRSNARTRAQNSGPWSRCQQRRCVTS